MSNDTSQELKNIISTLPKSSGVYQYFNKKNEIIYIGKAKNLKSRVSSYFQDQSNIQAKTRILVKQIRDIKFIVTQDESEALLLENSLIKSHQPKFNIRLKDDKSFPWIWIKKEPFPKILLIRNRENKKGVYFGPYTNVKMAKELLELIKDIYPFRSCHLDLSKEKIEQKKHQVCLDYHIKKCLAPCVGYQTEESYEQNVNEVKKILKGKLKEIIQEFEKKQSIFVEKMEFEKAHELQLKINSLQSYKSKSTVISNSEQNIEVYHILSDVDYAYIHFMQIYQGAVIQAYTTEIKKRIEQEDTEILSSMILFFREKFNSNAKEIILPFEIDFPIKGLNYTIPVMGEKKKLLELSYRNIKSHQVHWLSQLQNTDPERHSKRILQTLQKDLEIKDLPTTIECFDNSHIQGKYPVASCVVFRKAKPSKKDYKLFNLDEEDGSNDYAHMREVIYRRYKRLLDEEKDLPQLVVVDGGKGQLSAAYESIKKLNLDAKITVIGIAKRLEEIFKVGDSIPLYLDKNSESLKVLQKLRNEAHRFAINHHRNRRTKNSFKSSLEQIKGVGEKSITNLIKVYGSVAQIKKLSPEEMATQIGIDKAQKVYNHLKSTNN